nr:hypothetical protein [Gemmatimonadaceae bacterium]
MKGTLTIVAIAIVSLSGNSQAQVDYHRADLIRTAPPRMLGIPDDWGSGIGVAVGLAHPNW